jgi:hypothetical protein
MKGSAKTRIELHDAMITASQFKTTLYEGSYIFPLLEARKDVANYWLKKNSDEETYKVLEDQFHYYNQEIANFLGLSLSIKETAKE